MDAGLPGYDLPGGQPSLVDGRSRGGLQTREKGALLHYTSRFVRYCDLLPSAHILGANGGLADAWVLGRL